jgi:hypothetical protein
MIASKHNAAITRLTGAPGHDVKDTLPTGSLHDSWKPVRLAAFLYAIKRYGYTCNDWVTILAANNASCLQLARAQNRKAGNSPKKLTVAQRKQCQLLNNPTFCSHLLAIMAIKPVLLIGAQCSTQSALLYIRLCAYQTVLLPQAALQKRPSACNISKTTRLHHALPMQLLLLV